MSKNYKTDQVSPGHLAAAALEQVMGKLPHLEGKFPHLGGKIPHLGPNFRIWI